MTETPTRRGRPRGVESQHVMVRMPVDLIAQIDAYAASLQERIAISDVNISRGMAIRELVKRGLQSVQAVPPTPPTPQPAIPLAMEPAPKATLAPMEPQVDAPQETQPSPLVTHETLTPTEEADQEPALGADLPLPEPPPDVQPPSHLATVEEPELMATPMPPMATPQAPAAPSPASAPNEERIAETPSTRSQRGLPRAKLQEIADIAAQYHKLTLAELSNLLFDRGIYRARDRRTGDEKAVNTGTLQRWLEQARNEGMM